MSVLNNAKGRSFLVEVHLRENTVSASASSTELIFPLLWHGFIVSLARHKYQILSYFQKEF